MNLNLKDFSECLKELLKSRLLRCFLISLGILIVALLVFQAGMFVGYMKASFSYKWGDNYYRAFGGGPERGFFMERLPKPLNEMRMLRGGFSEAHGVIGKILKINLPTLVIQGQDKVEKVVLIKDDTSIMKFKDSIKAPELKVDDFVTVIGSPNDESQIEAKLIRLIPSPPEFIRK